MRAFSLISSLLMLTLIAPGLAQAKTKGVRIAYVDMNRALNEVEEGKKAKADLKKDFERKQIQLDKLQKSLKAEKEGFDKRARMMTPELRAEKAQALQKKVMQMQETYMTLQRELMGQEQQITASIATKLKKVIEKIGDRDGYDVILNINDAVLYHKRHQDITSSVIALYNKDFPAKK